MDSTQLPNDEESRLERLRALLILDTPREDVFDSIARMASQACGTPIALLSLVDAQRQWFKANVGLPGTDETPRDVAFCAHAIHDDDLFEIPDARDDPRFADNPLVTGSPDIRFYAGAPLVLSTGARVGTLCVIDRRARQLTADQIRQLKGLAQIAVQALEMRQQLIHSALSVRSANELALAESESRHRAMLDAQSELVSQAKPDGTLVYANPAYAHHFGRTVPTILGTNLFDYIEPADRDLVRERIEWVLNTGETLSGENRMTGPGSEDRYISWTNTRQQDSSGQPMLHSVGRDVSARRRAERVVRESEAFLRRIEQVAGVGGWQLDLTTESLTWSAHTRTIHEVALDFVPTLANAIEFYAPEARSTIEQAVQRAVQQGTAWDLELPLITAKGRPIWVRAVGEAEFDGGVAVRLLGTFQDITARHVAEQSLRELTAIVDHSTDFVVQTDWRGTITYMNPAARAFTGVTSDAVLSELNFARFNTDQTNKHFAEVIVPALKAHGVWVGETMVLDAARREVPVSHMVIAHRDAQGRVARYSAVMRDISSAVKIRQQLQSQAAVLGAVTEATPAMVAVVGPDLRYRLVNSTFERYFSLPRDQVLGRTLAEVLAPEDLERSQPWIDRVLAGETVQFERISVGKENQRNLLMTYTPLFSEAGDNNGFIGFGFDITSHRHEQSRLRHLSERDALTGLLNRSGFRRRVAEEVEAGRGAHVGMLYVDLDHFKPINDQHGHAVGDLLLQLVARRLQQLVRPTDAVARLGGDEFALLLCDLHEASNADAVADKVVGAMRTVFVAGEFELQIGASVGVAYRVADSGDADEFIARADAMLYRAKRLGRGRRASE